MPPVVHIGPPQLLRPIRIGPAGWSYGEPYDVFTTLEELGEGIGRIVGLDKPVSREQWLALAQAFSREGIAQVTWERIAGRGVRAGSQRVKVIDIQRQLRRKVATEAAENTEAVPPGENSRRD